MLSCELVCGLSEVDWDERSPFPELVQLGCQPIRYTNVVELRCLEFRQTSEQRRHILCLPNLHVVLEKCRVLKLILGHSPHTFDLPGLGLRKACKLAIVEVDQKLKCSRTIAHVGVVRVRGYPYNTCA